MLSLSTCWNSHRHQEGGPMIEEILQLGFQYVELSHGLKITQLEGILKFVENGCIKISSVHNFCPSPLEVQGDAPDVYEISSGDSTERKRALQLTEQSLAFTARIGADRLVMHLGSVNMPSMTHRLEQMVDKGSIYSKTYNQVKLNMVREREKLKQKHFDATRQAIDFLLPLCEKHGVKMGFETRSHYEQIPTESELLQLLSEYGDSSWIGSWHDFGHIQRKANLGLLNHYEALSNITPRLIGCHIHDVTWPSRDHRPPFLGDCVNFKQLLPLVPLDIPWVWELSPRTKKSEILQAQALWKSENLPA